MKPATPSASQLVMPHNIMSNIVPAHLEPRFTRVDDNTKLAETHVEFLYNGSLWKLTRDLKTLMIWDRQLNKEIPAQDEFPVLVEALNPNEEIRFPKGMIAIYTGHVRCNELANGNIVRVKRPTFIISNGRFIVKDMKNLEPVE